MKKREKKSDAPLPQLCGDFDMRIARDGTWYHEGCPVGRLELVKLFATVLRKDEAGDYWLQTPVEKARIKVDDAPFVAVELTRDGEGKDQILGLRTNLDETFTVDDDHPIFVEFDAKTGEPSPYVRVRDNLDALIARPVFYEMVDIAGEETINGETLFGLWSNGSFFELGKLEG